MFVESKGVMPDSEDCNHRPDEMLINNPSKWKAREARIRKQKAQ